MVNPFISLTDSITGKRILINLNEVLYFDPDTINETEVTRVYIKDTTIIPIVRETTFVIYEELLRGAARGETKE